MQCISNILQHRILFISNPDYVKCILCDKKGQLFPKNHIIKMKFIIIEEFNYLRRFANINYLITEDYAYV